ncbi:MAG: Xaa-Pro dipeptidase [Gammaproteobacteria bacterium]|nr:Xaa-Pro dipeptidase [Gammaproteobacteria bacterium]
MEGLYHDHLQRLCARADAVLAAAGYDGLVIASGSLQSPYLDDNAWPFRPNPRFQVWVPAPAPDCFVVYRPGQRPGLVFHQPEDYWYQPPPLPQGEYAAAFEPCIVRNPVELQHRPELRRGRWAVLGEPCAATAGLGDHDPAPVCLPLDYARAVKSGYELACMAQASLAGARAHRAAAAAFLDGAGEYAVHQAYCAAIRVREAELPYNNIVAFGAHAAVLHYQQLERQRPPDVRSFLLDAGARYAGYCCDITRTHAAHEDRFAALVRALDAAQQRLAGQVRPGTDYRDIHLAAHREIAGVLIEAGLVHGSTDEAVATGLTGVFFPHGIGHLLGVQVHDTGGLMAGPDGGVRPRPDGHPTLRLTRMLEAGMAVTIEPGVYFIESLLAAAAADQRRQRINWPLVAELRSCGGIRIEDNVVPQDGAPRNLTRAAFAAAA